MKKDQDKKLQKQQTESAETADANTTKFKKSTPQETFERLGVSKVKKSVAEVTKPPQKIGDILEEVMGGLKQAKIAAAKRLLMEKLLEIERTEVALTAMRKYLSDLLDQDIKDISNF